MMNGISQVLQRIQTIEERFGGGRDEALTPAFGRAFEDALAGGGPGPAGTKAAGRPPAGAETADLMRMIQRAARQEGVDPKLAAAVAEAESNFDAGAVSPAGAIGVMQLMPDTAAGLGVEDPYDARQNIGGGVRYLRRMLDTFGGDVTKAVAAYNAGPQAVKAHGGAPPYAETRAYVRKVLDLYR